MTEIVISATGLKKHYHRGSEKVRAVDGIDLEIHRGEMLSILGPSGSGKTTLINLLSGLDAPDEGSLKINGREIAGLGEEELTQVRRGIIGFVFQKFHLIPTLSVSENILLPLLFLGRRVDDGKLHAVLEQVGLADRASHLPRELSGGQMQRVAIARALITDPLILIADEPTGNLDRANGESIFSLFRFLVEKQRMTLIITTHNQVLGELSDRIIELQDGRITIDRKPK